MRTLTLPPFSARVRSLSSTASTTRPATVMVQSRSRRRSLRECLLLWHQAPMRELSRSQESIVIPAIYCTYCMKLLRKSRNTSGERSHLFTIITALRKAQPEPPSSPVTSENTVFCLHLWTNVCSRFFHISIRTLNLPYFHVRLVPGSVQRPVAVLASDFQSTRNENIQVHAATLGAQPSRTADRYLS